MAVTINWVPPSNTNVGSVLIYRSANSLLESLGSRSIITTVAARSGSTWVTTYTDSGGTADNLYRIQFWDGVGSSNLSPAMGQEYSELLCSFDDVTRLAYLNNHDVGSEQIYYAIKDATDTVFYDMGDPIKKSLIFVDSFTGVSGQTYAFGADLAPVYQVREVFVDDVYTQIVPSTSYEIDYQNAYIKFTDEFIGSYQGKNVTVNWVPMVHHILIKNMAALNIVEGELLFSGTNVNSPFVQKLTRKIDEIKDAIRPKGLYSVKSSSILTDYDVIAQKIDRTSLYFNH